MRVQCPYCERRVRQAENRDGPNFCPDCRVLFYMPEERKMPPWILGILTVLIANWQVMSR
jgi:hypothetical protein